MSRNSQAGTTLMETVMAMAIMSVMMFAAMTATSTALRQTTLNADRQFATQKAIGMLEELRALVQVENGTTITVLDNYDDGTGNKPFLTTQKITDPAAPVSGNRQI